MRIVQDISSLIRYREVLVNLVSADLKLRYRRSVLGHAWSLIHPIMTITIMTIVLTHVVRFESGTQSYVLYVFAGWLPWNFLVNGFWGSGAAIINNESVLRKIYLPKLLFPVAVTIARFMDFLINLIALFAILLIISYLKPSPAMLLLPVAILMLFLFTIGVTTALACVNVYIRDTSHMVTVLMQWGFYLTPIIYDLDSLNLKPEYRQLFELNPMTHIIRLFQVILSKGQFPSAEQWGLAGLVTGLALVIGYWIFAKLEKNLIFRL
jgi:ABC-type polysaccharide/polyol phosphate export permease